jgi:hypothetical protein
MRRLLGLVLLIWVANVVLALRWLGLAVLLVLARLNKQRIRPDASTVVAGAGCGTGLFGMPTSF